MLYKTIVLELLQQRPEIHEDLRRERHLLATVNRYSKELMTIHEEWKEQLAQAQPGSNPALIASQAMELAIQELEELLPSESPRSDDTEPLTLDQATNYLRQPTPNE